MSDMLLLRMCLYERAAMKCLAQAERWPMCTSRVSAAVGNSFLRLVDCG